MRIGIVVAGIWFCAPCVQAQSKASKVMGQFGWHSSLDVARTEAKRANKPLMIVFRCDP